jgi:NADPH:quinone reductase-like Zn-dependent oxidoreductase
MKALTQDRYGGADAVELRDIERPAPDEGQVLVRVVAAGMDRGALAPHDLRMNDLVAAGKVRPVLGPTFPLRDAAAALAEFETDRTHGRIVIAP